MASLGSGIKIPKIEKSLSDIASEELNSLLDTTVASKGKKIAEAVMCLKNTGQISNFSNVTEQLNIQKNQGVTSVVNRSTRESIPVVISDSDTVPASMLTDGIDRTEEFKVTISAEPTGDIIVLSVMPTISEDRSATYKAFAPIHHPGEIMKYESTSSRSWRLEAKLISRTSEEASNNVRDLNIIRSWVMPFYGEGTANPSSSLAQYLGAPPCILTLSGYGQKNIGPVKTVLENYSTNWPNDIDYIRTLPDANGVSIPFPVVMSVSLSLKETWSPAEYSGFDLVEYRAGNMPGAFTRMTAKPVSPSSIIANPSAVNTSEASSITKDDMNYSNEGRNSSVGNSYFPGIQYDELGNVISGS